MQAERSTTELEWASAAMAGLLAGVTYAMAAGNGSSVSLRDVGVAALFALVFTLADVAIQTGPAVMRRRPNTVRLTTAAVLLFGLVASGAIGPR